MKILIVDDEQMLREVLAEYAHFEGYETDQASDGLEAINKCKENVYDLIVMDLMMPKVDGFAAIKEIKKTSDTPILVLSARGEEIDKLYSFELGVDDYVVKPFSSKEVMARINAIIKRRGGSTKKAESQDMMKFDGLEIDFKGRNVFVDGSKVELTPKEYDLLFYMVKNVGIALSREKLLNDVWGYSFFGDYRTVDTHVKTLRSNLGEHRDYIKTVRGIGYKFEA